jgi:hypothetical protein
MTWSVQRCSEFIEAVSPDDKWKEYAEAAVEEGLSGRALAALSDVSRGVNFGFERADAVKLANALKKVT